MMLLGYCAGPHNRDWLECIKNAGFDYAEINLSALWEMAAEDREDLKEFLKGIALPCYAANCALPGGYSLVGGQLDRLEQYAGEAFAIAVEFGVGMLTVGSGGGRRIADGQSEGDALKNYTHAMALLGRLGKEHGIQVAIEPLNRQESDIVHSLQEGHLIAQTANVGVTADLYHMAQAGEGPEAFGEILPAHVHVCCRDRSVPQSADRPFIQSCLTALKDSSYHDMISVEAQVPEDFAKGAQEAYALIKEIVG